MKLPIEFLLLDLASILPFPTTCINLTLALFIFACLPLYRSAFHSFFSSSFQTLSSMVEMSSFNWLQHCSLFCYFRSLDYWFRGFVRTYLAARLLRESSQTGTLQAPTGDSEGMSIRSQAAPSTGIRNRAETLSQKGPTATGGQGSHMDIGDQSYAHVLALTGLIINQIDFR